jgi:putative thioredoxin
MPLILTDKNFEKEIDGAEKPILVDFFSTWCEPCSVLAPILEKIENDFKGNFILAKANLDDNPLVAQKFQINQIPTVILFNKGKPVSGFIGLRPETVIKEWLEKIIKENNDKAS